MGQRFLHKRYSRRKLNYQLAALLGGAAVARSSLAAQLVRTPAQTEGPFYPLEPIGESNVDLTLLEGRTERATGDQILVRGRVTDLEGNPLVGARVDIWQTNHWGRYANPRDKNPAPLDPNFQGIGITHTDNKGFYGFRTIRPAPYPLSAMQESGMRPRHIHFKVNHDSAEELTTQMYFAGDPLIESDEAVMAHTPEELRHLLITSAVEDQETGLPLHRFDIALG